MRVTEKLVKSPEEEGVTLAYIRLTKDFEEIKEYVQHKGDTLTGYKNRKLFFKDKGMLFTSMITPVILIVLYATFLAKVFRDSFTAAIPDMITISDKLISGTVAAQLTASLMSQ